MKMIKNRNKLITYAFSLTHKATEDQTCKRAPEASIARLEPLIKKEVSLLSTDTDVTGTSDYESD